MTFIPSAKLPLFVTLAGLHAAWVPALACAPTPPAQPAIVVPVPAQSASAAAAPAPAAPAPTAPNPLPISPDDPRRGPDDALVTVVLFGDIRSSWSVFLLERFEKEYAPQFPKDALRFVWKHHLFAWDEPEVRDEAHRLAVAAAAVQIAAGSEAFFAFVARAKDTTTLSDAQSKDIAIAVGASADGFAAALPAARKRVAEDEAIASGLPYPGPHFYVNGVSGNVRFSCDTPGTIAQELKRAQEALAAGTPRDQVYAERVRANVRKSAHCVLLQP